MSTATPQISVKKWFASGSPFVWLTASAVTVSLLAVVGLLLLIANKGLNHFWPKPIYEFTTAEQQILIGEIHDSEQFNRSEISTLKNQVDTGMETRLLIKTGNRDAFGQDFRWVDESLIKSRQLPQDLVVLERTEWGNVYGRLLGLKHSDGSTVDLSSDTTALDTALDDMDELRDQINQLEKTDAGAINYRLEKLRLKENAFRLNNDLTEVHQQELAQERAELNAQFGEIQTTLEKLYVKSRQYQLDILLSNQQTISVPLYKVVSFHLPNQMHLGNKISTFVSNFIAFVSDDPREANTEGGIFPAIFGTVMMVLLMSLMVTPFGVIAAVYLREYAKQGVLTRLIRIAVNNLAGVPSIVYGVFGLGFFVYFLGGSIDQLFYPEALPAPTFGTPGLLWSSLTLAILTVPVVIVATEEGLSRIPRNLREGSLALGATKWETLWKVVLPMASPAIMTGMILAVARAAGEVAPLMLVGVVKLAPSLPIDGNFPYMHVDRKFMHLGFHIYDVGFQSPNIEAARPLVYATALLLVIIIVLLNLAAIAIRNRLRERYKALEN